MRKYTPDFSHPRQGWRNLCTICRITVPASRHHPALRWRLRFRVAYNS